MPASPARFEWTREITVPCGGASFEVELTIPRDACGMVLVVRGNGITVGGRPPAVLFGEAGLATATCQVLTWVEREHPIARQGVVENTELLAQRLVALVDGVRSDPAASSLPTGIFASGTLGAAAMDAAARRPLAVDALVCRNGRLDASSDLSYVQAATMLLVSAGSTEVLSQNESAFGRLNCVKRMEILRERDETRSLTRAATLAREWFAGQLGAVLA